MRIAVRKGYIKHTYYITKKNMKKKSSIIKFAIVGFLLIVGLTASFAVIPMGMRDFNGFAHSISLGLDLQGGVFAVYQASMPEEGDGTVTTANLEATRTRLSDMLMAQGFADATVVIEGGSRIRVEVPDVDEPGDLFRIIGEPAQLEFRSPNDHLILTGRNVTRVNAGWDSASSTYATFLALDRAGSAAFATATATYINQQISIYTIVNDQRQLVSAPTVNAAITGGNAVITGMGSMANAQRLADQITAGQFEVRLTMLESATVSPTLGQNALMIGLIGGLIGLLLIIAFMGFFYRILGALSALSLLGYTVLMLFFLAALPWVQLTLPGIAGILLSIGMSVDGNIVMFERMKDEYRNGKSIKSSCHSGLKKGFWPVFDMEITTVIAAVVLLIFGTGPIQSFAVTLLVGVALAMFFNLVVIKFFVRWFLPFNHTNPKLFNFKRKAEFATLSGDDTDSVVAAREAELEKIKAEQRAAKKAAAELAEKNRNKGVVS